MMVMNEITFELAESSHPLNGSVEVETLSVAVMAVEPDELAVVMGLVIVTETVAGVVSVVTIVLLGVSVIILFGVVV